MARTFGNFGPWWHLLTTGIDADMITVRGNQIAEALATALEEPRGGGDPLEDELAHLGNRAQRHLGRLDPAIAQLSVSGGGGVPKRPVERVAVSWKGLEGDRQKFRVHYGHPIAPGAAGENARSVGWTGRRCAPASGSASAPCWVRRRCGHCLARQTPVRTESTEN